MKTICKNIAFSTAGECLLGKDCICEKNKLWLEETPANCYPEGGAVAGKDFLCEDQGPPECTKQCWSCEQTVKMGKVIPPFPPEGGGEGERGKVICPDCRGDGKETCHNPDHGFIEAMPGEVGRLGCPVCGHDPNHKVNRGKNNCETCSGLGHLSESAAQVWAKENNYDDEFEAYVPEAQPIASGPDHIHVQLESGAVARVSPGASPVLLGALNTMAEKAMEMPIPGDEEEDDIYDAVRKYRDAHPEKLTPPQPIEDKDIREPTEIEKFLELELTAARNKNNDDGIEIARLLAELKEKELIITGIEEGDEQWKAEYENLLATINKTSRSILNVYAPGNYYCNCCHCGEQFQGDKRAVSCLKCALSGHEKYVDELAERNAKLLAEKKEYAVNEQKIGRNLLDAYRVISGLLPANSQWQEKYIHKCNDLTAMIDEALQKSKELDALAPEIKRQTIDRLYNEILAAGVEFPPAAREVFHRAMNELTASPTSNKDNG